MSCVSAQALKPSRFAEATALEGSELSVLDPEEPEEVVPPPLDVLPPIVKVVLTTGQMAPPLSQDLK